MDRRDPRGARTLATPCRLVVPVLGRQGRPEIGIGVREARHGRAAHVLLGFPGPARHGRRPEPVGPPATTSVAYRLHRSAPSCMPEWTIPLTGATTIAMWTTPQPHRGSGDVSR